MAFSAIGITRLKIYGVLLLVNTVVLGLSAHINHFQEYFYKADVLPFILSLITMFIVLAMIFLDFNSSNTFTSYPAFELAWLLVMGIVWLAFNAFSTARWRYVDSNLCSTIPGDSQYAPYRTWCHEIQALRTFVWVEWVIFLLTFVYIFRWAIHQHVKGRTGVWTKSISRSISDEDSISEKGHVARSNSEFLQFEGFPSASEPQQTDMGEYMERGAGTRGGATAEPQFEFVAPVARQKYVGTEGGQYSFPAPGPYATQLHVQQPYPNTVTPDPFASPRDYAHNHAQVRSPSPAPPDRLIYPATPLPQAQSQSQPSSPSAAFTAFTAIPPSRARAGTGTGTGFGARSQQQPHPYGSVYSNDASTSVIAASPMKTKFAQAQAQAQGQGQGQGELRYASSGRVV